MKRTLRQQLFSLLFLLLFGELFYSGYAQGLQDSKGLAREHYYQGIFYGKQEKYTEAVIELEKAIELNPAYADAYNALAVVYHRQKQYQQAIEQYLLAIESNPRHVKARTNLAMIYKERQEFRKALRQLEKALESDPDYAPARNLIDDVKRKAGEQEAKEREQQPKPAKEASQPAPERFAKSARKSAKSLFTSGTTLVKQGKIDAGIRTYRKGLAQHPRSAEGLTLLGMAYRQKYHVTREPAWRQKEISAFSKAVKYNSKYIPALLGLGEAYYEQGALSKAIPYFQKVLQYQPNHPAKEQLEAIITQIQ